MRWKQIKYSNYEVSDMGDVRNSKSKKVRKTFDCSGYRRVTLYINNCVKNFLVHRLVAEAFIPNPNNLPEVNHINENKTDNRVENLEWCDREYNINYGTRSKRCYKSLLQLDENGNLIKEWDSLVNASKFFDISKTAISNCCNGRSASSCGFIWRYK